LTFATKQGPDSTLSTVPKLASRHGDLTRVTPPQVQRKPEGPRFAWWRRTTSGTKFALHAPPRSAGV